MAQAIKEEDKVELPKAGASSSSDVSFKFNVHAPEFKPTTQSPTEMIPLSGYYYHHPSCFHLLGGGGIAGGSDWYYVAQQPQLPFLGNHNVVPFPPSSKNFLRDDLRQKIIKQVEYQFSDMSLLSSDTLMKHIAKDPEGYVPMSVIASTKKVKSLVNSNYLLTQALRVSSKLVVSDDGKRVRRKHLFTERDKEDLQSRVVVADNLPEDNSYPNLEKIFGVAGSVKTIRVCHPQESSTSRSKGDVVISNKLHAYVEYDNVEQAERAVDRLNDERNWRKGLRVRLLLRRSPRSVIRTRKSEFDINSDDDEVSPTVENQDNFHNHQPSKSVEPTLETTTIEKTSTEDNTSLGSKKGGWSRGRGKSRGRGQSHNAHGPAAPLLSQTSGCSSIQHEAQPKQAPPRRGPRMPDGTRGFTMGRGKPLCV